MKTVLITGSSGLIGSEAVAYFDARGGELIFIRCNIEVAALDPGIRGRFVFPMKAL